MAAAPRTSRPARWVALLALAVVPASIDAAEPEPTAALDQAIAAAEVSLREGELQTAESRYRDALLEGWLLLGSVEAAEGRLGDALDRFRAAAGAAVETRRALQAQALVHLRLQQPEEAVALLTRVIGRNPKDIDSRRLMVEALVAAGKPTHAVQELEEARSMAPDDLEVAFLLASGYLRIKKVDRAETLFAEIVKRKPIPQTHVLIGRTYREFGEYDRARAELRAALKQDPRVRRAHYYLGMVAVLDQGTAGLEEAIGEFQKELKGFPDDPVTRLRLGMALVEAQRPDEALPALEASVRSEPPRMDAYHYLGRCLFALDRAAEAVPALVRALELAPGEGAGEQKLGSIHYQLGLALRALGRSEEAATHFKQAEGYSAQQAQNAREQLARYVAGETTDTASAEVAPIETSLLSQLPPAERQELRRRVTTAVARALLNLGVMQAQAERFARAAELFETAATVDPDFPQLQYSLGVARFNAQQFDKATGPLSRALESAPGDVEVKRMLALAWLNTEAYGKAAELLQDDPARDEDASLQYAYAMALVRSDRAAEAQPIFSRLLARHGDSAELGVVVGQAHAQQGNYDAAIQSLTKALERKPDVPEANATLGVIYLKLGRLPEAEQALRSELRVRPADVKSLNNLATVLDLEGRPEDALPFLRSALKTRPEYADARYLLGKILLAQGKPAEAVEHLEAAARLAPEDANIQYQLGQAYTKLGRTEQAEQRFALYQKLKDQKRGTP
jgi:tetratricopeptide (TPR) repeat protein